MEDDIEAVIKTLLLHYDLDDQALRIICDDNLFSILIDQFKDYELLAPHLHITEYQVYSIKHDSSSSYNLGKLKLLQLWKKQRGHEATYLALVQAFLAADDKHCAECIISHAKHHRVNQQSDQGNIFPDKSIPLWDDMTTEEKKALEEELVEQNQRVKDKYASCFTKISISFRTRSVEIDDVKALLLCKLPPAKPTSTGDEASLSSLIVAATTLSGLFVVLANYCTWFNHHLFESIIDDLGNEEEMIIWSHYKENVMKPYLKRSLFHVPCKSFSTAGTNVRAFKVCLKLVDDVDLSGNEALFIKKKVAKLLEVPLLELSRYEVGSVHLVFAIPYVVYALYPKDSLLYQYTEYDKITDSYHISISITAILFPANTTEACIINKILHCRQAEKEKLMQERDKIFQENKTISQENQNITKHNKVLESCVDTLQLELSILRKNNRSNELIEKKLSRSVETSPESIPHDQDNIEQKLSILNKTLAATLGDFTMIQSVTDALLSEGNDNTTLIALKQNVALLLNKLQETNAEKDNLLTRLQLEKKMSSAKSRQIDTYERQLKELKIEDETDTAVANMIPPLDIKMNNFSQHKMNNDIWYSPSFYTDDGGYCMCLRVDANGTGTGRNTHVSVFVYLEAGKNDDELQWPFMGSVHFSLLNQKGDWYHVNQSIPFDNNVGEDINGRVISGNRAKNGTGYDIIAHVDLHYNMQYDTEYLSNDTLHFRVTGVTTFSSVIPPLPSWYSSSTSVAEFIITDFSKHKAIASDTWCSLPFYSDQGGYNYSYQNGYKFCLVVRCNGYDAGEGTHVSVGICMLKGEYDALLKFPFRGTFFIEIVNWRQNYNHVQGTVSITDETDRECKAGGQVVAGTHAVTAKYSYTFLPHLSLYYNAASNTQYLSDSDCLILRIVRIYVH